MTAQAHPRNDLALAEAALFLSPQPLTRRALAKILGGVAQAYVDQLLEDLKTRFDDASRGIELHIEEGRAMFRVKAAYVNEVAHLAPQHDIPRQELRSLAVIAYNHPMTQADLIKVRGNKGYSHVQELIERNLITSEPHGRTRLLHVTRDFLRHFGLSSVEEFRFHFPTAAEENADALARATEPSSDSDVSQNDDQEDEGLNVPSGEMSDDSGPQSVDDDSDSSDASGADIILAQADEAGSESAATSGDRAVDRAQQEVAESDDLSIPEVKGAGTNNEPEDEPSEEPSQEVENG